MNAWQSSSANFADTFVSVISADTSALLYSTYVGGGFNNVPRGVAIDPTGAIVIAGQTYSDDFPIVNAAQGAKGNYDDAFIFKLAWH